MQTLLCRTELEISCCLVLTKRRQIKRRQRFILWASGEWREAQRRETTIKQKVWWDQMKVSCSLWWIVQFKGEFSHLWKFPSLTKSITITELLVLDRHDPNTQWKKEGWAFSDGEAKLKKKKKNLMGKKCMKLHSMKLQGVNLHLNVF